MVSDRDMSRRNVLKVASVTGAASLAGCIGGSGSESEGPSGTLGDWSLDINSPDPVQDRISGAEWTPPEYDDEAVANGFDRMNLGGMENDPATGWFEDYFNEKTGITSTPVTVPSADAVSKMRTLLSSQSESPAVLQISQEFFMDFVSQGWLEPVDNLWTEEAYELFPPYFQDQLTTDVDQSLDGEHTYISVAISEAHGLNYNPTVLQELGFDADFYDSATWADIREVCEEADSHSGDYHGWVWYGSGNRYPVYPFLRQTWSRGGSFVQDDGTVVVNNDAAVTTLEWQSQMIADGLLPDVMQYGEGGPSDLFLGGNLAGFGGSIGLMGLAREEWGEDTDQYDIALLPRGENGEHVSYMNTDFLAINRFAPPEKKRAGMVFMDGGRSAIASAQEYDQEGNYPANTMAWEHELLSDAQYKETAQRIGETAKVELWPNQIETYDSLVTQLQEAWLGQKSPQEALDSAQSEVDSILEQN
ncbi:ABC transporter substrate-binding protein [Natrinema amylolyticum]|uniref:ABC transporter substrate-binding protein n=1 Tax=Natrinema amylolyticum TaxID=2878679 RepID=UPI001CF9F450|nr:substrate-binding domain-containing protein [Natrinema amylolyticum]